VLVTADGVPVLRHDERLADGTPVRSLDLETLRRLARADEDDLPRVAEVLAHLPSGKTLNLELKVPGAARALRSLAPLPPGCVLTSFYAAEAMEALAAFPSRRVGLLVSRALPRFVPEGLSLLAVHWSLLEAARERFPALRLWAWTLDGPETVALARRVGAEAWIGDDVATLRGEAGRPG
jgi:glycerophosphoryl diester phosphodiesterase